MTVFKKNCFCKLLITYYLISNLMYNQLTKAESNICPKQSTKLCNGIVHSESKDICGVDWMNFQQVLSAILKPKNIPVKILKRTQEDGITPNVGVTLQILLTRQCQAL